MRKHLLSLLFLLGIFMLPERVCAYDFMWDEDKYVVRGIGSSVSIELPIYDKDDRDMWVIDGYVYVKASGKSEQTLLHYKSEGDIDDDDNYNEAQFDTSMSGVLKIKDTSGSWVRLNNTASTVKIYSSGDQFTAKLEWEAPYDSKERIAPEIRQTNLIGAFVLFTKHINQYTALSERPTPQILKDILCWYETEEIVRSLSI